tara:strand:- start:1994 stop:2989 length:996 start_codon:yes stop_codon:yes gene_type:complete
MSNKTIKINPEFFSISNNTKKNKTSSRKKKREDIKQKINLLKPNKAKKELLEKIKLHQKKKKNIIDIETEKSEKDKKSKGSNDFQEKIEDSMNYLDNLIKTQKKEKEDRKRNKKEKNSKIKERKDKSIIEKKTPDDIDLVIMDSSQPKNQKPIGHNKTIKKHTIKDDPPYGILKGGKKPTYSQYHTIKSKPNHSIKIENHEFTHKNNIPERKVKLDEIKRKNAPKKKKFKKFKVKTTTKTYKLGKNKNKRSISVLLKNNITKKKINQDLLSLRKTPIKEIKKYLREKNLIKYTTKTPEYILQAIYINAMLSGDLENINKSNLIYNYLNEEN